MVGWMDDEALHRTLTTGRCTYWSRSRQEYWVKGGTSGHVQQVKAGRARLRRGHRAGEGGPDRRGLPHRRPDLLRRGPAAGHGGGVRSGGVNGGAMTAPEPAAEPLGTRRPAAGARREYLLTLLAGAVGAAVVLLAARQGWARVVTVEPHPLPVVPGRGERPGPGARGGRAGPGRAGRPGGGAGDPRPRPADRRRAARRVRGGHHRVREPAGDRGAGAERRSGRQHRARPVGAGREHGRQRHHAGHAAAPGWPASAWPATWRWPRSPGAGPCWSAGSSSSGPGCWSPGVAPAGRSCPAATTGRPAGSRPPPQTRPACGNH